jgi:hypothetical protein
MNNKSEKGVKHKQPQQTNTTGVKRKLQHPQQQQTSPSATDQLLKIAAATATRDATTAPSTTDEAVTKKQVSV